MTIDQLPNAARVAESWDRYGSAVVLVGLVVSVLALVLTARRIAKSERPDEYLMTVAMLIGLGWSSEAVWVLTGPGRADLPTGLRVAIFTVLEVILVVSMVRTKRAVDKIGAAGRAGRTVWIVASGMALVGMLAAGGVAEGVLRAIIPLLLTLTWWQGVVPEGAERDEGLSSWRWTPRRFLLWAGAIEPGERDVETVHRERMTQQMTKLEFRRRGAVAAKNDKRAARLAAKLSRMSLLADDDMIAEVRRRVTRASWYQEPAVATVPVGTVQGSRGGQVSRFGHVEQTEQTEQPGSVPGPEQPGSVPGPEQPCTRADVPGEQTEPNMPASDRADEGTGQTPERSEQRADLPSGAKLTREEALERYGEQLVGEWLTAGEAGITEYRVRKVCGLSERPAKWVHGQIGQRVQERRRGGLRLARVVERG